MSEMGTTIITEPSVRLVGRQTIDEAALAGFLADEDAESWTTDTDNAAQKLVEVGGRLCYSSYSKPRPGGNAAYLRHILEVGHGSVIEHAVYNFIITGVSRSMTHELVRHRAGWAYSQRSQRFVNEEDLSVVVPPALADEIAEAGKAYRREHWETASDYLAWLDQPGRSGAESEAVRVGLEWLAFMDLCRDRYEGFSDYLAGKNMRPGVRQGTPEATLVRKQAREAARSVLPNATETQIFVTFNARAGRHFIEARGDESADAEIRRLAVAMLRILQAESLNLFGDYEILPCPSGGEMVATPYRKV